MGETETRRWGDHAQAKIPLLDVTDTYTHSHVLYKHTHMYCKKHAHIRSHTYRKRQIHFHGNACTPHTHSHIYKINLHVSSSSHPEQHTHFAPGCGMNSEWLYNVFSENTFNSENRKLPLYAPPDTTMHLSGAF